MTRTGCGSLVPIPSRIGRLVLVGGWEPAPVERRCEVRTVVVWLASTFTDDISASDRDVAVVVLDMYFL